MLVAGELLAVHVEQTHFPAVAPEIFPQKNQGLAFQRVAAHAANVLPGYGSSELAIGPAAERAAQFFSSAPTGFQLSVIAKPGASSFTILEKIAALGPDLRGRKVVISISPGWFLSPGVTPARYAANFSAFAASALTFGRGLDFNFKREIALRMLEFPRTLARRPLLRFALQRLASLAASPLEQTARWSGLRAYENRSQPGTEHSTTAARLFGAMLVHVFGQF